MKTFKSYAIIHRANGTEEKVPCTVEITGFGYRHTFDYAVTLQDGDSYSIPVYDLEANGAP